MLAEQNDKPRERLRPRQGASARSRAGKREPAPADQRFQDRQGEILKQAARLFSAHGYAHVSLEDVAQRLDIAKPAIYYYFRSKEQILFECFMRSFDVADEVMKESLETRSSARERLEHYMRGYVTMHLNGVAPSMPLHDLNALSPALRAQVERRRRTRRNRLRDLVAEGISEGSFRPCDPGILMSAWGGASTWVIESFNPRGGLSAEAVAEQLVSVFLQGALARP